MNTAEELALLALVQATTQEERRKALSRFVGRGVRLSDAARAELISAWNAASTTMVALQPHPGDERARRIVPRGAPSLDPETKTQIQEWLAFWRHADKLRENNCEPPGGLLLWGPPGTGKTHTTEWIAGELADIGPAFALDAHAWIDSHMGESGRNLSKIFASMQRSTLVLEELDAVGEARSTEASAATAEGNRVTIALMRLMEQHRFPIVATTNRYEALDPALARRFDLIVQLPEPNAKTKRAVIESLGAASEIFDLSLPIVDLVRMAKQARRRAVLEEVLG